MQPHVGLKVALLVERLSTVFKWTYIVTLTLMLLEVHLKALSAAIGLSAARVGAGVLLVHLVGC